jgi:hypothetical protein
MQEFNMQEFSPQDLDVLSRAYHRVLDRLGRSKADLEFTKSVLLRSIVSAARNGERDEHRLVHRGLAALGMHKASTQDAAAA